MEKLLSGFVAYIKKENLFLRNDKLLVAVSGGVDSVVLCHLCKEAQYDFAIAHCNFQLRGKESMRDEDFVASLAKKYNVPLFSKRFDTATFAEENKMTIQVAARHLRYKYFGEIIIKANEANKVVHSNMHLITAHHSDDNVESVLMNFFKGTGIRGLRGMLPKQVVVSRPLLFAQKKDLLKYAEDHGLIYMEDSSNESIKYTRNYFRNVLIPGLEKVFPQVSANIDANIQRLRDTEILFNQSIDLHKKQLIKEVANQEVHLPVRKLLKTAALQTVLYELLHQYGVTSGIAEEVIKLLHAESGKYIETISHRIIRNRDWIIVAPLQSENATTVIINENESGCMFEANTLQLAKYNNRADFITAHENIACIDAKKIVYPLILRKCKIGDYFYPLGMDKKKKVSKFLSDLKLSVTEKEKTWVLESEKKIIWVIGRRIDNRFRVVENTTEVLKISVK